MLRLRGISRTFHDGSGLGPTDLDVGRGEFVAVLGPSGCGKSTLLRCVAGLETPTSGVMELAGRTVFDAGRAADGGRRRAVDVPPSRRGLSMVFQDLALWPHMSVAANVEFPLTTRRGRSIPADERHERVHSALDMVGIAEKAESRPHELSGGQQQRVAIARAVIDRPDLLLMDEPLSALDAALRVQIRREIVELSRELGLTVLYVTHDQEEALSMADRVLVLDSGSVAQYGTPVEIYERPANEFVADFVGTMNRLGDGRSFRPEELEVEGAERPAATGDASGAGAIEAVVETCAYVGGRFELRCGVDGAPRPWLVRDHTERRAGERLRLVPHPPRERSAHAEPRQR